MTVSHSVIGTLLASHIALTIDCNLYTPKSKSLKNFYYLGTKAWNSLPVDLRNMSDPKVFGKIFKSRLLDSIINDPNYIVNNAYDYLGAGKHPSPLDISESYSPHLYLKVGFYLIKKYCSCPKLSQFKDLALL